jgi:hypothetical protein
VTLVWQKKKHCDSSDCCVPRKSFRVPFWTRVPKIRQPFSSNSVFPLRMVSSHSIFTSSACPSYHKEKWVKHGNLWTLRLSCRISSYRTVRSRYKDQSVAVA